MWQVARVTPAYLCPVHGLGLTKSSIGYSCRSCTASFGVDADGIARLDVVQAAEAGAFDERTIEHTTLSDDEVSGSKRLAERFLAVAALDRKPSALLDVACGRGELCAGLLSNPGLRETDVFAFDHSLGSLRVLERTARKLDVRKQLHLSQQDARALCFSPASFDLVVGNAVLHHFLDYEAFIRSARALLTPGGVAVFAEPFAEGYLLAMTVLKLAVKVTGVAVEGPGMGLYQFITDNIGMRIRNTKHPAALAGLTDKHFFSVPRLLELASALGFTASFVNMEDAAYYDVFLDDILATYRITEPAVVAAARELYLDLRAYTGDEFPQLFAHFRLMRLQKR